MIPRAEIRSSAVKVGYLKSMLAMRHYIDHGRDGTDALSFGRLAHVAILTPECPPAVWDGGRRAGPAWAAFLEQNVGREIATAAEWSDAQECAAAVYANRHAAALLADTKREMPIDWMDSSGGKCGTRADAWKRGILVDVKTTRDISARSFTADCARMAYHVQFGFTRLGLAVAGLDTCPAVYVISVESSAPWDVAVRRFDPMDLNAGQKAAYRTVIRFRECENAGVFGGVSDGIEDIVLPPWATGEADKVPAVAGSAAELA